MLYTRTESGGDMIVLACDEDGEWSRGGVILYYV